MTDVSIASEVEVAGDPATVFTAFTDEINLWWLRGPINNWDSARILELRCEPGIGGRLLEIYDEGRATPSSWRASPHGSRGFGWRGRVRSTM